MQTVLHEVTPATVDRFHQLSMRLAWASRRQLTNELDAFGLTAPQFMVLHTLIRRPDGCSMSELAEASQQVSATMTGIVDRLYERGLVQRSREEKDRRSVRILLDPSGMELLNQIVHKQKEQFARLLADLLPDECQQMLNSLSLYLEIILPRTSASPHHLASPASE